MCDSEGVFIVEPVSLFIQYMYTLFALYVTGCPAY
jgi:hypothetical protein